MAPAETPLTLWQKLGQTWPARFAQSALEAAKLPGDVYAGRVTLPLGLRREDFTDIPAPRSLAGQRNTGPVSYHPADDVIGRATDLAGLVMSGGSLGGVPVASGREAVLGSGMVPRTRTDVERAATRLEKLFRDAGVEFSRDKSRVSPSTYYYLDKPDGETLKVRISQHADRYGADFSVDPRNANFADLIGFLRGEGFNIADRVKGSTTRFLNEKKKLADEWTNLLAYGRDAQQRKLSETISAVTDPASLKAARDELQRFRAEGDSLFTTATGMSPSGKLFIDANLYDLATGTLSRADFERAFARHPPEQRAEIFALADKIRPFPNPNSSVPGGGMAVGSGPVRKAGNRGQGSQPPLGAQSGPTAPTVPANIGSGAGSMSSKTIEDWLTARGIPFKKQASGHSSESSGPSPSTYYRIETPNGPRDIRLSDHDAPHAFGTRTSPLDLRFGDTPQAVIDTLESQLGSIPRDFYAGMARKRISELENTLSTLDLKYRGNQGFADAIKQEISELRRISDPFPNPNSAAAGIGPAGGPVLGSGATDKRTGGILAGLMTKPSSISQPANINTSQAEIAASIHPLSRKDRDWQNYGRHMTPEDVLDSEVVWGAAALAKDAGGGRAEAFAAAANDLWGRMGANQYISPELARKYIARKEAEARGFNPTVVKDDKLIDILRKYGIAGLTSLVAASAEQSQASP